MNEVIYVFAFVGLLAVARLHAARLIERDYDRAFRVRVNHTQTPESRVASESESVEPVIAS